MMTQTIVLISSLVAGSTAAQTHPTTHMSHGEMADCPMSAGPSAKGDTHPIAAGQDAFGAIAEIVELLEDDPTTDWNQVDIGALREHLLDMSELMLRAESEAKEIPGGLEVRVRGSGRALAAIHRMVPSHTAMLRKVRDWKIDVAKTDDGVTLRVIAADAAQVARIRGLGFFGFMTLGHHHGPHHLAIARGHNPHE